MQQIYAWHFTKNEYSNHQSCKIELKEDATIVYQAHRVLSNTDEIIFR